MTRTIMVQAEEQVACPKCNQRFPLSEGFSRQAIERHAGEFERALAEGRKKLEARLAGEAKAQFDIQLKALNEQLAQVSHDWAASLDKRNRPGSAVLAEFRKAVAK